MVTIYHRFFVVSKESFISWAGNRCRRSIRSIYWTNEVSTGESKVDRWKIIDQGYSYFISIVGKITFCYNIRRTIKSRRAAIKEKRKNKRREKY